MGRFERRCAIGLGGVDADAAALLQPLLLSEVERLRVGALRAWHTGL
jgi:hypothetical protein